MSVRGTLRILGIVVALQLAGSLVEAQAQTVPLPFTPTFTFGNTAIINDEVLANADGSWTLIGQQQGAGPAPVWDLSWNLTVKQDPFIVGSLTVTNLSSTTRNFMVAFGLPILPAFESSVFGGSLSATLQDAGGATSASLAPNTSASPSIFRGTIDGNTVLSLFAASLSCNGSSAGCSASLTDSDGMPIPNLAGPAVNSTIGILLNFTLSPGDRVTFNANFTVEPVPLPAALPMLLLALGSLGAGRMATRRGRSRNCRHRPVKISG